MFVRKGQALGSVHHAKLAELRAERPTAKKKAAPVEPEPQSATSGRMFPMQVSEPDVETTDDTIEQPKDYASKADWVAWAVSQGADEAEAEALTKHELIELYGGAE